MIENKIDAEIKVLKGTIENLTKELERKENQKNSLASKRFEKRVRKAFGLEDNPYYTHVKIICPADNGGTKCTVFGKVDKLEFEYVENLNKSEVICHLTNALSIYTSKNYYCAARVVFNLDKEHCVYIYEDDFGILDNGYFVIPLTEYDYKEQIIEATGKQRNEIINAIK